MKNYLRKMDSMHNYTRASLHKIIAGMLLLLLAVGLQTAARGSTEFADWYAGEIYPFWVSTIGRFWSFVPYSVVEILLYGLIVWLLLATGSGIMHICRRMRKTGSVLLAGCGNGIWLVGGLFFVYTMLCGINYHSTPFSEKNGMELQQYSIEELASYCKMITEEVNELSGKADRKKLLNLKVNEKEAVKAMDRLGERYEGLSGYYPKPKGVGVSEILSYQQLTGVYSPFTVEANYNADMTAYNLPFTMCHELSHLRGFMREDEANYIAYLACRHSENPEFQYSGALMAWIYSTNLLYDYAPSTYDTLRESLLPEVRKDLQENTAFWKRYEGKTAEVADKINDTYLKANKQTDGVLSYDRMVDLLMAEYLTGSSDES